MTTTRLTRRTFTSVATGVATGIATGFLAAPLLRVSGQEATAVTGGATPVVTPLGFVSTRLRIVTSAEARAEVDEAVIDQFVDQVKGLNGYRGYLLADVIDQPTLNLAIVALENASQAPAFNSSAGGFVASVADKVIAEKTVEWAGDVLIRSGPAVDDATPLARVATPAARESRGYLAVRIHTSKPGKDPRDIVPAITTGFLPIVTGLPGFKGYLWYPIDGGFVAISLFDSVESATASNEEAKGWIVPNVTDYTDGNPQIVNANVIYADLPILTSA